MIPHLEVQYNHITCWRNGTFAALLEWDLFKPENISKITVKDADTFEFIVISALGDRTFYVWNHMDYDDEAKHGPEQMKELFEDFLLKRKNLVIE